MTILNTNYRIETGEHGLAVITVSGRCTGDAAQVAAIEGGCTRVYDLVRIPQAAGAVLRAKDGVAPTLVVVTPSTIAKSFSCVKVDGRVNPLAPQQTGGAQSGSTILSYMMKYQEVGGVA